jgi:hypothetical protein
MPMTTGAVSPERNSDLRYRIVCAAAAALFLVAALWPAPRTVQMPIYVGDADYGLLRATALFGVAASALAMLLRRHRWIVAAAGALTLFACIAAAVLLSHATVTSAVVAPRGETVAQRSMLASEGQTVRLVALGLASVMLIGGSLTWSGRE